MATAETWAVSLEKLAADQSLSQGRRLSRLVRANVAWLPSTTYHRDVRRYGRGVGLAAASIVRSFWRTQENIQRFIISTAKSGEEVATAGLAKIVRRQAVRHPEAGRVVRGTFVDYWLGDTVNSEPSAHSAVASAITAQAMSGWAATKMPVPDDEAALFTTIEPGREHQPGGFRTVGFEMVGNGPDILEIAGQAELVDAFGITKQYRGVMELYCLDLRAQ